MNKYFLGLGAAVLSLPLSALGATYMYVDNSGEVQAIEAADAESALTLSASDRDENSGVALGDASMEGDLVASVMMENGATVSTGNTDGSLTTYQYVTVTGDVHAVEAATATEAMVEPSDIHPESGVVYAEVNPISSDVEVDVE